MILRTSKLFLHEQNMHLYTCWGEVREIRNSNDVVVASERHIYPDYYVRIKK